MNKQEERDNFWISVGPESGYLGTIAEETARKNSDGISPDGKRLGWQNACDIGKNPHPYQNTVDCNCNNDCSCGTDCDCGDDCDCRNDCTCPPPCNCPPCNSTQNGGCNCPPADVGPERQNTKADE